jgi:CheY-like chemotaxis protein
MERSDSGLSVLQALRLDPALRDLPVIFCTADVPWLEANTSLLRAKGYELLAKPFALRDLLTLVRSMVGSGRSL